MVAKDNILEVGQSRIGLMVDGLPDTPRVAVKLERTERSVEITIPFLEGDEDIYQYWFSSGIMYGDDPERTKRRYEPPRDISFYDALGSVGLVGSRVVGSRMTWGGSALGEGRLAFDYAILGASTAEAFHSLNGLRSEVEGLGTWIGLRSLAAEQEFSDEGRLQSVNLRLSSTTAIRVQRRLNTEFQSNWRYGAGPGPDETTISERMQVHTRVQKAVTWEDHWEVHIPVRNLLRVAAWRRLQFVSHEVASTRDPLRTLDGRAHGDQWLPLITQRTGMATKAPAKLNATEFLFTFGDVGPRGVGRWIALCNRYERGLTPLVGLLDLQGASLEAHLAQVGIGYETIGYELLISSGLSKRQADAKSWEDRVRAVTAVTASVLPFSEDEFVARLRRNYRAVKHADNAVPDAQEMLLVYWQAIQVFRAWVALRLGMKEQRVRNALERDQVTRHIRSLSAATGQP
jgi:hypothetical protein